MSRVGPSVFTVKSSPTSPTTKVYIGSNHRCTCGGGEAKNELCVHILYVVLKVLRVPEANPLAWQLGLVDTELDNVLAGRVGEDSRRNIRARHAFLRRGGGRDGMEKEGGEGERPETKDRRDIAEDEVCAICQEEMTPEELENEKLCYCKAECGSR